MAKEKKKKDKNKEGKKTSRSSKGMFLLIIVSLAMIIFLQMTYLFFIIGILPSIVAFYIDRTRQHSLFHSVFACNLSGVLPFMAELINNGNKVTEMQMMLSNMEVLLIMFSSAGFGWILYYTCPLIASFIINTLNDRRIARLEERQGRLLQEWGKDIINTPV